MASFGLTATRTMSQLPSTGRRASASGLCSCSQTIMPAVPVVSRHFEFAGQRLFPASPRKVAATAGRNAVLQVSAAVAEAEPATADMVRIKGGKGGAVRMKKGDIIKIVNTHGTQVVDFWAFDADKWGAEMMSMHHTRNALNKMTPQAGDLLYTASMTPIMTFLEDTGPGVHDTTAAACSPGLYVLHLGEEAAAEHDSCTNNLHNALAELGLKLTDDPATYYTPAPFNLWMNVTDYAGPSGYTWIAPPNEQKPGDYATFRAEKDLVAVMSACPWDLSDMNGAGGKPQDVHYQVMSA